eukprot:3944550-Alexandrium_andersonii.AAC.1
MGSAAALAAALLLLLLPRLLQLSVGRSPPADRARLQLLLQLYCCCRAYRGSASTAAPAAD